MTRQKTLFLAAGLAGLAGLFWSRRSSASTGDYLVSIAESDFATHPNYLRWRADISAAEARHGIPAGLLARLLYQESRYRSDVIDGRTRSRVGAKGIAQIIDLTGRAPGYGVAPIIDASGDHRTDPARSIAFAGAYLAAMHRTFGTWPLALAAYNWGPGYLAQWQRNQRVMPSETRTYVASISGASIAIA